LILIDAHVHIYDCFDLGGFFDSAYSNFQVHAARLGHADDFSGVLLLAETSADNWFQHLSDFADGSGLPGGKNAGDWRFHRTNEFESLHAQDGREGELFLIAGRQIVTREKLELLALATTEPVPDGIPIKEAIERIREKNGISVIPWGLGKWMGKRGAVLDQGLETAGAFDFFLGDNRHRPIFLFIPSQFKLAQRKNIRNLPGSDPLPLKSELNKAGSFGFTISEHLDPFKPAAHLKELILAKPVEPNPFGKPAGPCEFFKGQVLLRLNKLR
jgi:hypothetical protein